MADYIDIYCERLDGTFWAEPLNALSNAAFLIAAMMAARLAPGTRALDSWCLIWLIAVIGVGSFAFHTLATPIAMAADVIPILVYQLMFLGLYGRRVIGLSRGRVAMIALGFIIFGQTMAALPNDWLNGSLAYAPALVFLLGYAVYHRAARKVEPAILLMATGVFAVSLVFRSIDQAVCPAFPIGVHYMWHMLNAVVLYLTTRTYIRNR